MFSLTFTHCRIYNGLCQVQCTPTQGERPITPNDFDRLVQEIETAESLGDEFRLRQGEAAVLLVEAWGHGALKEAASQASVKYSTLAERYKVVSFYGGDVTLGQSTARDLLAEMPGLIRWTHLRDAKAVTGDTLEERRKTAIGALVRKVDENLTTREWYALMRKLKGGGPQKKFVFTDHKRRLRITVERLD